MLHLIIIGAYLAFVVGTVVICNRLGRGWIFISIVVVLLLLAPFWDVFLAKGIMFNFAHNKAPLQMISQTIEKPESVIWIDNVWPGFDEYGRQWMVESYLDGIHLKTLALNDGKGNLYVYRATAEDFAKSAKLWPAVVGAKQKFDDLYQNANRHITNEVVPYQAIYSEKRNEFRKIRKQEIEVVLNREERYSFVAGSSPSVALDQFNYRVQFDPITLPTWQEKLVWCDRLEIRDLSNNAPIANNMRCLAYTPMTTIIYQGGNPFEGGLRLGDERAYEFDDQVLFGYADVHEPQWDKNQLRRKTYRRNVLYLKNI